MTVASVRQACAQLLPTLTDALHERAEELRDQVDVERRRLLHAGVSPETLVQVGALQLGWADFLDALGGRRP